MTSQDFKHSNHSSVFNIFIATWLVELMRRETGAGFGRIRLNGVAFIKQPFVVKLSQQPPNTFHVFGCVSNIRIFHVDPIAHFFGELVPDIGVAHNGFFTSLIVCIYRNFAADIFFGNAEFLFYAEFYR